MFSFSFNIHAFVMLDCAISCIAIDLIEREDTNRDTFSYSLPYFR